MVAMTSRMRAKPRRPKGVKMHDYKGGPSQENSTSPDKPLPRDVAVLNGLIMEAWLLVHHLADAGIEFPGTLEQATLTIAGNAYPRWRSYASEKPDRWDEWGPTEIVGGFVEGIAFAMATPDGMMRYTAHGYNVCIKSRKFLLDSRLPLAVMARYWPDFYTPTGLKLRPPKLIERKDGDESLLAQTWQTMPNAVTAPPMAIKKAVQAAGYFHPTPIEQ